MMKRGAEIIDLRNSRCPESPLGLRRDLEDSLYLRDDKKTIRSRSQAFDLWLKLESDFELNGIIKRAWTLE
jgi:hypothetical protein